MSLQDLNRSDRFGYDTIVRIRGELPRVFAVFCQKCVQSGAMGQETADRALKQIIKMVNGAGGQLEFEFDETKTTAETMKVWTRVLELVKEFQLANARNKARAARTTTIYPEAYATGERSVFDFVEWGSDPKLEERVQRLARELGYQV